MGIISRKPKFPSLCIRTVFLYEVKNLLHLEMFNDKFYRNKFSPPLNFQIVFPTPTVLNASQRSHFSKATVVRKVLKMESNIFLENTYNIMLTPKITKLIVEMTPTLKSQYIRRVIFPLGIYIYFGGKNFLWFYTAV